MLKAMRQSFMEAVESAPSILLVDELDSMSTREARMSDGAAYNRGIVNGFLECLDGLESRDGVLVIATTNEVEVIDPAVLRSGRIDVHIEITLPDAEARLGILKRYLGFPIAESHKEIIGRVTEGHSGADLEVLARRAHRFSRADGVATSLEHVLKALPRMRTVPAETHRANALHEAGHAVVGLAVHRTIVDARLSDVCFEDSTIQALGRVRFELEKFHRRTRDKIFHELLISLGGIAAEIIVIGQHDEGAAGATGSDLDVATRIATKLEAVNGMGKTLVSEPYHSDTELRRIRQTNSILWQRVETALHDALDQAKALVTLNLAPLHAIAQELQRSKVLTGDDIQTFLAKESLEISGVQVSVDERMRRSG